MLAAGHGAPSFMSPSCPGGATTSCAAKAIKVGTKMRNIRLVDGVGDHDIYCKVDGFGPMQLKSSVVKKV